MTNVVIGNVTPYTQATATSGQTVFMTNWTANAESDVVVYQTPSGQSPDDQTQILAYPADYSVAFIGDQDEVQVTLVTGAGMGDIITITRQTPADFLNLYVNTNFTPTMLNNDFGILTLVDQQAELVNQLIAPRYNYSATINQGTLTPIDTILPILAANEVWVKNSGNTAITTAVLPEGGIAPATGTFVLITADTGDYPNSFGLSNLSAGILINDPASTTLLSRTVTGTSNQITITNPDGISGNINIGITSNPIIPGTAGMGIPEGSTAQRVTPGSNISLRYNTDVGKMEYYNGNTWVTLEASSGDGTVTSVATNNGLTGGPITTSGTIGLANISDANILSNISGSSTYPVPNTLTSIIDYSIGNTVGDVLYRGSSSWSALTAPATTGLFLKSNSLAAPSWSTNKPIVSVNVEVIPTTGTYTPTSGMVFCEVEGVGGGGGGGGAASTSSIQCASGSGGASGGAFLKRYMASDIGASAAVVIGSAGSGGSAGANNGSAGGTTSFTPAGAGVVLTATGGGGGAGNSAVGAINVNGGSPAAGGSGSNGDVNVMGQAGSPGVQFAPANASLGGAGGSPPALFGTGGATAAGGAEPGNAASGYGGGGGGAANGNSASAMAGGNGTPGLIIITEYIAE